MAEAADTAARAFERACAEGRACQQIRQERDQITSHAETDPLQAFSDKVAAVFSRITGGKATLEFAGQLPAQVVRGAVSLPMELLSHGGGGGLALAVRLAMAEACLAQGGGLSMCDDPCVCLDATRMGIAAQVVRKVSATAHVIVFICHDHHTERGHR